MNVWGSDTAPSMPEPVRRDQPILKEFEGFGFTAGGIAHVLSLGDWEEIAIPMYGPEGFSADTLRGGLGG